MGCDSLFHLQLNIHPNVNDTAPDDTVCQYGAFSWAGHAPAAGHRMIRINHTTHDTAYYGVAGKPNAPDIFNVDVAGDYEFRDSIRSKTVPFADPAGKNNIDSIYLLFLRVRPQPELVMTSVDLRYDTLCLEMITEAFHIPSL